MGIPEEALIRGQEILSYIPQRDPVVMVDTFYGIDGGCARSGLTIAESNIFMRDGVLDECGLVEHMAQSAALRAGYLYRSRGEEVPLGFIASVGKLKVWRNPAAGEVLKTTVTVVQEVMDITLLTAEVTAGCEKVCECTMKIFLKTEGGNEE